MRSRRLYLGWLCVAALVPALRAIIMVPLSIPELADQSEIILHGRVTAQSCQRDPEGRIFTRVEFETLDLWKGIPPAGFTIVHGGGMLGEERTVVSGQVGFALGEEFVAFLVLNQYGEGVTLGLAQGKFHVWTEPAFATASKLARNPFHGLSATASSPAAALAGGDRLVLSELKRQVLERRK